MPLCGNSFVNSSNEALTCALFFCSLASRMIGLCSTARVHQQFDRLGRHAPFAALGSPTWSPSPPRLKIPGIWQSVPSGPCAWISLRGICSPPAFWRLLPRTQRRRPDCLSCPAAAGRRCRPLLRHLPLATVFAIGCRFSDLLLFYASKFNLRFHVRPFLWGHLPPATFLGFCSAPFLALFLGVLLLGRYRRFDGLLPVERDTPRVLLFPFHVISSFLYRHRPSAWYLPKTIQLDFSQNVIFSRGS